MYDIMSFNWSKFFDVGLCMKNISKREEYQRSAVGRFYYAAFGLVKKYFEKNHYRKVPSDSPHKFLIEELKKSNFEEEIELGKSLEKLRDYRNFADYNNKFYIFNVKRAKDSYEDIIEILEHLEENPLYLKISKK